MDSNQPYTQQPNMPPPQMPGKPCKYCKQMIDARASVCPFCKRKQSQTSGCLLAVLLAILIPIAIIIFVVIGIGVAGSKKKSVTDSVAVETDVNDSEPDAETDGIKVDADETKESGSMSYEVTDTSFHYYQNSIGTYEYYGIVEITNTGTCDIYLKDCTFDLEDNDGHLLQSDDMMVSSCPDVIKPGEKGYFYNNLGATTIDESVSFDNGIKLVPNFKLEEARGDFVLYDVSDTEMREDDYGKVKVTGRVTNNTDEDDSMCYVEFIFRDANGKALFIFGTNVMGLDAGTTKSFDASALFSDDSISMEDIASYDVVAAKMYYQF